MDPDDSAFDRHSDSPSKRATGLQVLPLISRIVDHVPTHENFGVSRMYSFNLKAIEEFDPVDWPKNFVRTALDRADRPENVDSNKFSLLD